jgi:hypothetical protein
MEAANLEALVDDLPEARRWMQEHRKLFPHDPMGLATAAVIARRMGKSAEAESLARRALVVEPNFALAHTVLRRLGSTRKP